ncbi:tetratricopeptide repeat protein [Desulfovibrionales bacterium]
MDLAVSEKNEPQEQAGPSVAESSQYCMATDLGLECVCSKRESIMIGTGTTARKEESTLYFYAAQVRDDVLALQSLNAQWAPSGPVTEITWEQLVADYQPEVDLFLTKVKPVMKTIAKSVARGDRYRSNGAPFSAAREYNTALGLDEHNVRALFGLGLTYLQYNQPDKAKAVFEQMIVLEGLADPEYKHLFNQFGIELRKKKMIEESRRYYARAIELCQADENLYFNLARAFHEGGQMSEAAHMLGICLEMNPSHCEAKSFQKYLAHLTTYEESRGR